MPASLNEAAVRKLLRQHPKVHPDSVYATELKAIGLGHLPFLEWDLASPWGKYLECSDDARVQEVAAAPGYAADGRPAEPRLIPWEAPSSYRSRGRSSVEEEAFQLPEYQTPFAGFQQVGLHSVPVPHIQGFEHLQPAFAKPSSVVENELQAVNSFLPKQGLGAESRPSPVISAETARLRELEAEEAALLEEVLSLDQRQGLVAAGKGLPENRSHDRPAPLDAKVDEDNENPTSPLPSPPAVPPKADHPKDVRQRAIRPPRPAR